MGGEPFVWNSFVRRLSYLLVTGLPSRLRNSSFGHALPRLTISSSEDMLLCDRDKEVMLEAFSDRFRASIDSMILPAQYRDFSLLTRGKFSRRMILLFDKSQASKSSLAAAMFSMEGMPKPRITSSRSRLGFTRCSARSKSSAEILMVPLQ